MDKLTISIVNYNAGDYLLNCLKSIRECSDEAEITVFVVDNASTDGSIQKAKEKFPKYNYILNSENKGFGRAHNQVLEKIKSGYILILNPDVEIKAGVFKTVLTYMDENSNTGAATCKILLPDGSLDWASHRGFPTPFASLLYFLGSDRLYHLSDKDFNKVHEVDAVSGSFLMTKKSVLEKSGLFDEDYFMYAEDIDLCYRIKKAGFKIVYIPSINVLHHKGISSGLKKHTQLLTQATIDTRVRSLNAFYETMKIFYRKHYEKNNFFLINWLIYSGINLKWWLAKRKMTV